MAPRRRGWGVTGAARIDLLSPATGCPPAAATQGAAEPRRPPPRQGAACPPRRAAAGPQPRSSLGSGPRRQAPRWRSPPCRCWAWAAPSRGRHHPSRCLSRGPQMWPGSSTVQRAPAACRTSAAHPRRPPPAQPCSAGTQCEAAGTERHAMAGPGTSRTALHAKKYNRCVDLWPEARLRAVSGEEAEGAGPVGG